MREPISLPRNPSQSFKNANPHLYGKPTKAAEKAPAKESPLEEKFLAIWETLDPDDELGLRREHRFDPTRRWRFDFAWPERRVALETEGGTFSGGRHNRGGGFARDCEKYNRAVYLGYSVIRLPTGCVTEEAVKEVYEFVKSKRL